MGISICVMSFPLESKSRSQVTLRAKKFKQIQIHVELELLSPLFTAAAVVVVVVVVHGGGCASPVCGSLTLLLLSVSPAQEQALQDGRSLTREGCFQRSLL